MYNFAKVHKQVAQRATILHLKANIIFRDTIFYNAQRQITLNLKQRPDLNSNTNKYDSSAYLRVSKRSKSNGQRKLGGTIFYDPQGQLIS